MAAFVGEKYLIAPWKVEIDPGSQSMLDKVPSGVFLDHEDEAGGWQTWQQARTR
jgi:hypothetical protein